MGVGTITRRMDSVLDGLDKSFKSLYTIEDFERKIEALKGSEGKSSRPSVLASLFEMFDICNIEYKRGENTEYYQQLVLDANFPSFNEIEDKMIFSLYSIYEEYPTPEEYMSRIVHRLSKDDYCTSDSLRVRILKRFIKYGDYLSDAGYGGKNYIKNYEKAKTEKKCSTEEIVQNLDDGVFDVLKTASKPQKKPEGKFGLLKLADDLASGKFRTGGATKKGLYLFAMVYEMSYYSGNGDEIINYETDIEKNLFRDYYCNNLMRYITREYEGQLCEYEPDPSGQGINYKNFAEIIYIYFISKDIPPQTKIALATRMMGRVQRRANDNDIRSGSRKDNNTSVFRNRMYKGDNNSYLFSEDIINLNEVDFEEFVATYYDCNTEIVQTDEKKAKIVGVMQVKTEQETAYEVYKRLIGKLEDIGTKLENCNYGLWFADVAALKRKAYNNICDRMLDIDPEKFKKFVNLLSGVNSFLGYCVDEKESNLSVAQEHTEPSRIKIKALHVADAKAITRTSLIVAYYYYYNAVHENTSSHRMENFQEMFMNFKTGIDELLEEAYYQPLNGKSIFDVLVAFSSYAYLNI